MLSDFEIAALNFLYIISIPLRLLPAWVFQLPDWLHARIEVLSPMAAETAVYGVALLANYQIGSIVLAAPTLLLARLAGRSSDPCEPLSNER